MLRAPIPMAQVPQHAEPAPPGKALAVWPRLVAWGLALVLGSTLLIRPAQPAPPTTRQIENAADKLNLSEEQVRQLVTRRGLTIPGLLRLPRNRLPTVVRRLSYTNLPRERQDFWALQLRNERGIVPANAQLRAANQLATLRQRLDRKATRAAGIPIGRTVHPRSLQPRAGRALKGVWEFLGPENIGGRTRAILIHPTNHDTMWLASVGGGIWRTDNGGKGYYPVNDLMANLVISSLVMDPADAQVMYAGTGEGYGNSDALRGAGIFRSSDGGKTWEHLPGTSKRDFNWINRLTISRGGKIMLAGTGTGSDGVAGGIWRSDDRDRKEWKRCLNDPVGAVVFDPADTRKAIAGGLRNGKAYYSEDGGETWKTATAPETWSGRVELVYARADSRIVYASVDRKGGELWRSGDGGRSYTLQNTGSSYLGGQGWYDNVVWAGDPTNADLVLVGGIDLWRSVNGGKTLTDISTWWAPTQTSAHADQHVIVAHPAYDGRSNRTVFFGNDGGLYRTDDVYRVGNNATPPRTNGWVPLVRTYGVTQFYTAAGNPKTGTIIAGAQDNGTLRYTRDGGSLNWTWMFGGDGGHCAFDPQDEECFYGEYVNLNIHRSRDGAKSAEYISGQFWDGSRWAWKASPYFIPDAKARTANFIAPFVIDPSEPNRLLGGGLALWRTNNAKEPNTRTRGPAWASIKEGVGSPISAIAVAQGNSDLIWVGHNNGAIYRTSNGTEQKPTWTQVNGNGTTPLPARYCTRIVIDPKDNNTVYATFGGYSKGNVWRTANGGKTWDNLGEQQRRARSDLPDSPVWALAIHPRRRGWLYIGTAVGLFTSADGGQTWSPTNEGPTSCAVWDLSWMNSSLLVTTHGRGLLRIDIP